MIVKLNNNVTRILIIEANEMHYFLILFGK